MSYRHHNFVPPLEIITKLKTGAQGNHRCIIRDYSNEANKPVHGYDPSPIVLLSRGLADKVTIVAQPCDAGVST